MEKVFNNRIIAISGEPVSGKGTTVKCLIEKLKQEGYLEENIHIKTTGHEFRKYFNIIFEFIKNIDNPNVLKNIGKTEEMQEILKNYDYRNLLKITIAKLKNSEVNLEKVKIEDVMTIPEFSEIRRVVDTIIDENTKKLGIEINKKKRNDEIWLIDSRLAFNNIPNAFSVRLTTNPDVAAQRLFKDQARDKNDTYSSIEEAKEEREKRKNRERQRYIERYNVDLENIDNYDLIIDTSYSNVEDIANTILECAKCYEEGKEFGKMWTSQKVLLPLQSEMETLSRQPFSPMDFEELLKEIEKNGYIPSKEIEVINVEGKKYIIEGHHRNFASAYAGKTLVPYKILASDDEKIPNTLLTARQRAKAVSKGMLYGHEYIMECAINYNNKSEKIRFSYNDIYPGIYEEIDKTEELYR